MATTKADTSIPSRTPPANSFEPDPSSEVTRPEKGRYLYTYKKGLRVLARPGESGSREYIDAVTGQKRIAADRALYLIFNEPWLMNVDTDFYSHDGRTSMRSKAPLACARVNFDAQFDEWVAQHLIDESHREVVWSRVTRPGVGFGSGGEYGTSKDMEMQRLKKGPTMIRRRPDMQMSARS